MHVTSLVKGRMSIEDLCSHFGGENITDKCGYLICNTKGMNDTFHIFKPFHNSARYMGSISSFIFNSKNILFDKMILINTHGWFTIAVPYCKKRIHNGQEVSEWFIKFYEPATSTNFDISLEGTTTASIDVVREGTCKLTTDYRGEKVKKYIHFETFGKIKGDLVDMYNCPTYTLDEIVDGFTIPLGYVNTYITDTGTMSLEELSVRVRDDRTYIIGTDELTAVIRFYMKGVNNISIDVYHNADPDNVLLPKIAKETLRGIGTRRGVIESLDTVKLPPSLVGTQVSEGVYKVDISFCIVFSGDYYRIDVEIEYGRDKIRPSVKFTTTDL